jgi:hypothetical protein
LKQYAASDHLLRDDGLLGISYGDEGHGFWAAPPS